MFYNFRKNKKAFTLVELIVVIAIIAILGAVVGVTVSTFVQRARRTAATNPLTELANMWENKEDSQSLNDYIKDLLANGESYKNIRVSDKSQLTKKTGLGTFNIYFHDDNCGDYYGVLKIKDGMPDGAASASDADDDKTKFTTTYKDNKITE